MVPYKPLGDLLVRLCVKPFKNGESFIEGTQYIHSLAPMLLLNTIGIACVKYGKFRELDSILKLSVPAPNFMTPSYRESLLTLLGSTHWNYEDWNELIGQRYYYPMSIFYLKNYVLYLKITLLLILSMKTLFIFGSD